MRRGGILQPHRYVFELPSARAGKRIASSLGAVAALCAVVFFTASFGVQFAYADRIPAGVTVLNVDVGGRTRAEARGLLQASAASMLRQPLALRINGQDWPTTPRELGMSIDTDDLLGQAYGYGREGNPLHRIADQWSAIFRGQRLQANGVDVDAAQLDGVLQQVSAEIDRPARSAHLALARSADSIGVTINPEQAGVKLDAPASAERIATALAGTQIPAAVDLIVENTAPSTTTAELQAAKAQAELALSSPLVLAFEDRRWTIDREDIARLLVFERTPGRPDTVGVNPDALNETFAAISKDVELPAIDARFSWNGGNLKVIRDSQEGRGFDADPAKALIRERLFSNDRTIQLALTALAPRVSSADGPKLGIKELIRDGRTAFAGSVSEKQQNIALAAARLNGVVVAPGAMFSFNREVGPTTLESGFKTGWGITLSKTGAQTVPSVAGGICQVATTLFHPVFHAGYAIEERHSHLYWIPSYGQPPLGMKGLDATVDEDYGLDFRFINTTSDALLIQSRVDGSSLIFELYGTKPTWDVKIDGPSITNVVAADRTPVSQPEPSMPQGRTLQVEGAQDGFDVTVTRTVTSGDDVRSLPLKSHYVPSHNVVLYGTGTS